MFFNKKKHKNDAVTLPYTKNDLDILFYKSAYPDLSLLNNQQIINHWLKFGQNENRIGKIREEHHDFDAEFYSNFYADIKENNFQTLESCYIHFVKHGEKEGRSINLNQELIKNGIPSHIIPHDFDYKFCVNENKTNGINFNYGELLKLIIEDNHYPYKLYISKSKNSEFYCNIGRYFLENNKKEKARKMLLLSLHFYKNPKSMEYLANICTDKNETNEAIQLYSECLKTNKASKWVYYNLAKAYISINEIDKALNIIFEGGKAHPDFTGYNEIVEMIVSKIWSKLEQESKFFASINDRPSMLDTVLELGNKIYEIYYKFYTRYSEQKIRVYNNPDKILIVGDYHVPQCIRYRIDQKIEQLKNADIHVKSISWTDLAKNEDLLAKFDTIIFYRVPAIPTVTKYIAQANALGKLTFYEIDDLLFEQEYPHDISTYGGYVNINTYIELLRGMPLFRLAATFCLYGISSTKPLCDKLEKLVVRNKCYLHRNGLDEKNIIVNAGLKNKNTIDIFYGSGTQAHNSDFTEIALPAVEKLLSENKNIRLTIMGYLSLPSDFINKYDSQIIQIEHTKDLELYQQLLSSADINLAVLISDTITDCKSELKWFEAAAVGIPSVVSDTKNYIDVINHGVDGYIAKDSHEYYKYLNLLVKDKALRLRIAQSAQQRVLESYSVNSLSDNIRNIIEHATSSEQMEL